MELRPFWLTAPPAYSHGVSPYYGGEDHSWEYAGEPERSELTVQELLQLAFSYIEITDMIRGNNGTLDTQVAIVNECKVLLSNARCCYRGSYILSI